MANEILQYTSKDFDSIKKDLIASIDSLTSTWTSRDEGDPGIVLINLMSSLGDMLSYNADKQALEYYASTVTQRKNAYKLFELIGYQMHWFRSARTQITLKNAPNIEMMRMFNDIVVNVNEYGMDSEEALSALSIYNSTFKRNVGTDVVNYLRYNSSEVTWEGTELLSNNAKYGSALHIFNTFASDNLVEIDTYINSPSNNLIVSGTGSNSVMFTITPTTEGQNGNNIPIPVFTEHTFNAAQGYLCSTTFNRTQLRNNRYYIPDMFVDESCMFLGYLPTASATDPYDITFITKVDNLLTYIDDSDSKSDKLQVHFQFRADEFDRPYIELSNYWETAIGKDAVQFKFFYLKTLGSSGNITKDYLTIVSNIGRGGVIVTNKDCTNALVENGELICSPGYDIQTAHDAYVDSINYIMTYNTLVTIYDFARFVRRQEYISNATAIDCQYAKDLNKELYAICSAYTDTQIKNILGSQADSYTHEQLVNTLYQIKKVNYDYMDDPVTESDINSQGEVTPYKAYGLNIHPICFNFDGINSAGYQVDGAGDFIAEYGFIAHSKNDREVTKTFPYKLYRIFSQSDTASNPTLNHKVEDALDTAIRNCRIVNVDPEYTAVRVFEWRCCGTLHLTKSVSRVDAENIIKNVIEKLKSAFNTYNIEFGKKITYMDVIQTILEADSRINYFDAGIGSNKLISYTDSGLSGAYNVEAYFNPESIMRYVQTYEENSSEMINGVSNMYYNMIIVDPNYIQE